MNVLKMIGSTSFLMANKEIIRLTDIETAILYSDLAGAQDYWSERSETTDGYFFRTQSEIELNTTLSAKVQLRCLRVLEDKGLIKTKVKGLPAKKYFSIDSECMHRLSQVLQKGETCIAETEKQDKPKGINRYSENVETSIAILDKQDSTKGLSINNRINNNKEIIIDNDNKEKSEKQVFAHTPERKSKVVNISYKLPDDFSHELKETFEAFMLYKKQRKETYKSEHSINLLIKKIQDNRVHFSDTLIIEVINMSMENNWAGIFFDKLQKNKEDKKQIAPENPFLKPIKFDLL
jgi:DNA-binding PadR family transcriptional regulator